MMTLDTGWAITMVGGAEQRHKTGRLAPRNNKFGPSSVAKNESSVVDIVLRF